MKHLARALVNVVAFLELSDDSVVDPDAAVEVLDEVSRVLSRCSPEERRALKVTLGRMHATEQLNDNRPEVLEFFESFLAAFGLEEDAAS
jgi:hypothetical protein